MSKTFAAERQTPALARHWVAQRLAAWEVPDADGDIALMVSELTTNAVRHGRGPVVVNLSVAQGILELAVADAAPASSVLSQGARGVGPLQILSENGRGLPIVNALAHGWGVTPGQEGKDVWFRWSVPDIWPYQYSCPCDHEHGTLLSSGARVIAQPGPWDALP